MKKIAEEAKKNHKTLIAFTHYPMVDFNDGASNEISKLLGNKKWQLERVPEETVAKVFVDAGLQIHFAGHMHINDTGIKKFGDKMLVNVQVPSLAAYLPAYKILTINSDDKFEVQTVVLNDVPHFDDLFPLYQKEYKALKKSDAKIVWNKDILKARSYHDFMLFHLKELVRLRMIPNDWPNGFIEKTAKLNGKDLLFLSLDLNPKEAKKYIKKQGLNSKEFKRWTFEDLLLDLYKFQSADELAKNDIPKTRLKQYQQLEQNFELNKSQDPLITQLKSLFKILSLLSNGDPSNHFEIDLKNQTLNRIQY